MNPNPLLAGLDEARRNWGWFLVLGIGLIVLGSVALGASWLTTLASVLLFGWLLVFSGVLEVVAAFLARQWSGLFLHLLSGVLNVVVGVLILAHPGAVALGLLNATLDLDSAAAGDGERLPSDQRSLGAARQRGLAIVVEVRPGADRHR